MKRFSWPVWVACLLVAGFVARGAYSFFLQPSNGGTMATNTLVFFPDRFTDPSARRFAEAVAAGKVDAALAAAHDAPGGVNTVGRDGATGLLMAVERHNLAMVDALLKAGANPDGAPDRAPLHLAVSVRDLTMVKRLLAAHADPNATMGTETPLYMAGVMGEIPAAQALLDAGADINKADEVGKTPILAAAAADNWQTVAFLLDHDVSLWADADGMTVAQFAQNSRILPNNPNGEALPRVIERFRAAGYPWPPPNVAQVRALKEEGKWPPPGKR
ncbi:ankyrin repeat domain-containing protein [Nitrospirillum sp. BR 11163]|uniref:ankyrin repeat domain-containing protein n=1 Tax=Nitrospirillum sp. BR 11163 TaxID=3104323 RepID=UPI002AFF9763|nr:ankyrin repeat domain-containing protein [Nitrospirillum sp. BR 11163]MEA1673577.1 ankyrin repeat domain-containing protein [Nitrospirillum sp. BR 11163]